MVNRKWFRDEEYEEYELIIKDNNNAVQVLPRQLPVDLHPTCESEKAEGSLPVQRRLPSFSL